MASTEARIRRLLLGVALAATPVAASGQSSELRGRVLSDSGAPIVGATVTLTAIRYSVRTDSLGRFHLAGTPGSTLGLRVQAPGFRDDTASVVLTRERVVVRDFTMVSEATALPEVNPSNRVWRVLVTSSDNEPLAYANIQMNGGRRYVTDDSGRIDLPARIGQSVTLLARRIGFAAAELRLTSVPDTAIRIKMNAVARTLETQVVTVRSPFVRLDLNGFYARMAEVERTARVGYFVTPEDLAIRNPQNVTDAVEQFPSIRLRPINDENYCGKVPEPGQLCGHPNTRRMRIEDDTGCPLTVYLDGIRIQPSMVGVTAVDEQVNTLVQPHSVAGIEVYPRGVGAPSQYPPYGQADCRTGVVLIWTK
jgi:hypothetical protein